MDAEFNFSLDFFDSLNEGVYYVDSHRKILYWNKGASNITGYAREEVVGKGCWDGLLTHIDGKGKNLCRFGCPLTTVITGRGMHEMEAYLHHKDGHRVPVFIRSLPLKNNEGRIVGGIEIFSDLSEKKIDLAKMQELAKVAFLDPVTGFSNQNHLKLKIESIHSEVQKIGAAYSAISVDIKNYFSVLDRYDREIADGVVRVAAKTISAVSKSDSSYGRWSDTVFLVLVYSDKSDSLNFLADKYKGVLEKTDLSLDRETIHIKTNVSIWIPDMKEGAASFLSKLKRVFQ